MGDTMIRKVSSNSSVVSYEQLIIADLAGLIVEKADRNAHNELLNRHICMVNGEHLTLPGYLLFLKDNRKPEQYESVIITEEAYNLVLFKFCSFPDNENNGVDCRRYYRAYLHHILPLIQGKNIIEQEKISAQKLKSFLYRQNSFSVMDAKRKVNGFSKTYIWKVGHKTYRVQMPSVMTGKQCREWLKDNIGHPNTQNLYEKERIQQIVDGNLFIPSNITLDANSFRDFKAQTITPLSKLIENEMKVRPLSECIANEKADNLDFLRSSIARIGKNKVRKLVMEIFDAIINDTYKPSVLGSKFGVSPAAMTRFASLKWSNGNGNTIPQLWLNLARYVVNLPQYSKMLYETGLYDKLCSVVQED